MGEATLLESRLSKVEQDNRRLKLTVGALLLVMAAVPLIGAVLPEQIPQKIQAQQFEVIHRDGTRRVMINGNGFILMDQNDTTLAAIAASGIAQYDGNGNRRNIMADDGIFHAGADGTLRAAMAGLGVIYADANGNVRARMNDDGISYSNENGTLVWSTECAPNC